MGTPLDLYDRPQNTFVAGFIGSPAMNLLSGEMTENGFRIADGIVLPVPANSAPAVTYGIRPEHLQLDPSGTEIEIVVLEPTGSETLVIGRLGGQTINGVFRERITLPPGSMLRVRPDLSAVHLFDAAGQRVN
jgi:multiple sugar transport system ATP-binding protein